MAVQALWSGTVSFSLVAIPVRLVPALSAGRTAFHLLHRTDHARLTRRMFCPEEQELVPPGEIARGYEIAPDSYVVMTDAELDSVSPERSRTIEILDFIDLAEVDPVYFDHPYYLVPMKGGEKAYRLLVEIMQRTNKAGLAKFVLAEREHSVAVLSRDGALAVITLHRAEEVRTATDAAGKDGTVRREEIDAMKKEITRMISAFRPERYADERGKRIRALLAAKAGSDAVVNAPAPPEEVAGGPPDLMAALEESMRKARERR